jgi:predicted permease
LAQAVVICVCLLILSWYAVKQKTRDGRLFAVLLGSVIVYVFFPSLAFYLTHTAKVDSQFWNSDVYPISQHLLSIACLAIMCPALKAMIASVKEFLIKTRAGMIG